MAHGSLGRAAGELLGYVQLFVAAPESHRPAPPELRSYVLGKLDEFMRGSEAQAVPPDELAAARFALVAFCDEMILRSGWSACEEWGRYPLQFQLFQTRNAGEEFFDQLGRLRPDENDAREIFFFCLALGFVGRFADDEPGRRTLMAQQYEHLRVAGRCLEQGSEGQLQPAAYDVAIRLPKARSGALARVLGILAASCLTLYGVLWLVLWWAARGVPVPGGA